MRWQKMPTSIQCTSVLLSPLLLKELSSEIASTSSARIIMSKDIKLAIRHCFMILHTYSNFKHKNWKLTALTHDLCARTTAQWCVRTIISTKNVANVSLKAWVLKFKIDLICRSLGWTLPFHLILRHTYTIVFTVI